MFDDAKHPDLNVHLKHYLDAREERSFASRMKKSTTDEGRIEKYCQDVAREDHHMRLHEPKIPAGALTRELKDLAYEQGFCRAGRTLGMDPDLVSRGQCRGGRGE